MLLTIKDQPQKTVDQLLNFLIENKITYEVNEMKIAVFGLKEIKEYLISEGLTALIIDESSNYYFVSKKFKENNFMNFQFAETPTIIGGPCSIESNEQITKINDVLNKLDLKYIRGGAFKPRTSPYGFQGLGKEGLDILNENAPNKIKVVEIMSVEQLKEYHQDIDIIQIGARNMQNYELLKALGSVDNPIILKRHFAGTVDELLSAAEYIYVNGNEKIILCERGIRTFEPSYRNTLDLNAVLKLKELTNLPVIVDPSHGSGDYKMVKALALAGVAVGADGLLIETHPEPNKSISDKDQTVSLELFKEIVTEVRKVADVIHKL